jgi:hypothetical protein
MRLKTEHFAADITTQRPDGYAQVIAGVAQHKNGLPPI